MEKDYSDYRTGESRHTEAESQAAAPTRSMEEEDYTTGESWHRNTEAESQVAVPTKTEKPDLIVHVPPPSKQYYYIKNVQQSQSVLSLAGEVDRPDRQFAGTRVVIKEKLDPSDAGQKWYLEDAGDGYCYIVSMLNGLVLDIDMASWAVGTPVIMWPKNSPPKVIANQKWKIDQEEGVIVSQLNGQVVQARLSSLPARPHVHTWPVVTMKRTALHHYEKQKQQWEFEPVDTCMY